jgi:hypothetical protein
MELRFGCEVLPLIEAMARSTMSRRRRRRSRLAAAMPLVSCVWKWIGMPTSSFSALTSFFAA